LSLLKKAITIVIRLIALAINKLKQRKDTSNSTIYNSSKLISPRNCKIITKRLNQNISNITLILIRVKLTRIYMRKSFKN